MAGNISSLSNPDEQAAGEEFLECKTTYKIPVDFEIFLLVIYP